MRKKGFTLIELLVVIAIIGLLSTLAVVALNSSRLKARDAKRVADVKQIQTALELYFNDQSAYPSEGAAVVLGASATKCLGTIGFSSAGCADAYMGLIPVDPLPAQSYTYVGDNTTYSLIFSLEGPVGGLGLGVHTADQNGLQ